jgi:hypothetical protein
MTQQQFLFLTRDIQKTPPIRNARINFIEAKFKEYGDDKQTGYETLQYYINELQKAFNGENTVFKGRVIKQKSHWGIVDKSAYFVMSYKDWEQIRNIIAMKFSLPHLN